MKKALSVPLFDMVGCLSEAMDLVSAEVSDHQKRVAYLSVSLGEALGFSPIQQCALYMAGALHDCGALSLKERLNAFVFEGLAEHNHHAELGYRLLKTVGPFSSVALMIRHHHRDWDGGRGVEHEGEQVPLASHILHLADKVDTLIDRKIDILFQMKDITTKITNNTDSMFSPDVVAAFRELTGREHIWFDLERGNLTPSSIDSLTSSSQIFYDYDSLSSFTNLVMHLIDFRSRFTATHSSGVSATAEALAKIIGMSLDERKMIMIAGNLHDLGKLAVPTEILEKPAELTAQEFFIIQRHPFFTYRILESVKGFETINEWGAYHHESMDGTGYPFHITSDMLSLGSRIMSVADIFTALTENRPYRAALSTETAIKLLTDFSGSELDGDIVNLLAKNLDEIDGIRKEAQDNAHMLYHNFMDVGAEAAL